MSFSRRLLGLAVAATAMHLAVIQPAYAAMSPSSLDVTFATKAAQGGIAEVADAKQALQTTRNGQVDPFASRMIADHSKANARLSLIMKQQGIPQPSSVGAGNQATYSRMEGLVGKAFDVTYIAAEKAAHQEMIDLFRHEVRSGKDAQLVTFATSTLPVLQMHLAMLQKVKL